MNSICKLVLVAVVLFTAMCVSAQWAQYPTTGSSPQQLPDRTKLAGMTGLDPELKAGFVQKSGNAKEHKVVVRADVWGVDVIPPDSNMPQNGTAFLSFALDNDAPVKTSQQEHTFENLSAGQHTVTVRLLSQDGQEIGSNVVLGVRVPD